MPNGGKLVFRTFQKENKLYIETEDTGGINETTKPKIFDRFFTTKDKGLGLSVVCKIVSRYNARIEIFNTSKGTKFLLTFSF
ncbi:MAG: ATP-binding protein [Acidobacteriota bacterium]|nr:ATP-binding protein [Acidobacteriota bacterium]